MENNANMSQTPQPAVPPVTPVATPVVPQAPQQQEPPQPPQPVASGAPEVTTTSAPVKHAPNMMLVIPLLVLVVAIIGGAYWFMNNQRTSETVRSAPIQTPTAKTAASSLEEELNAIDVESNDSDFADVDRDLKSL